jgi:hypothetical protein
MNKRNGRELWEDIVELLNASNRECVRSLRIALFMLLQEPLNIPFLRQARQLVVGAFSLIPKQKTAIPEAVTKKVLFCFAHRTASNMQNLLPVAREAHRRGLLGGIISSSDFSRELAEFDGQVPIATAAELSSQLGFGGSQIANEAFRAFQEVVRMVSEYDQELGARCRSNAGAIIAEIIASLRMERAFQVVLESWSPSCVVSTSDLWPLEYQLVHQASGRQIPSIVLQHGNLIYFYWPFKASLMVLWGEQSFNEMIAFGAPSARLKIGGMPASDTSFGSVMAARKHSDGEKPVCLILSHTHAQHLEPELYASYKRFLSELISIAPFVQWKVKLHPSENRSFYDDLDPQIAAKVEFYPASTSLKDSLREADVATTLYSTSGMEAMIMGRPVIVPIVSPRMTEPNLLPQIPGALRVRTPQEFSRELKALVSSPDRRTRQLKSQTDVLNRCFANQGRASSAIVDILEAQVNSDVLQPAYGGR